MRRFETMEREMGTSYFNTDWKELNEIVKEKQYSKVYLIADSNTFKHCFPIIIPEIEFSCEVIEIEPGENSKDLEICAGIWTELSEKNADRNSLLIGLGGGVVTDLTGFIASVYKRGIDYISVPTSLLAMVDAAIGGKTGIDFLSFKNQLGSFYPSKAVFVQTQFLKTLPESELMSGFAELIKHALIADRELFESLLSIDFDDKYNIKLGSVLPRAMAIKEELVKKDPLDKRERKLLNFGHTIGHAIESLYLMEKNPIPHGFAVAIGMLMEAKISTMMDLLSDDDYQIISSFLKQLYPLHKISEDRFETLMRLIQQDKKRQGASIQMTLLQGIGQGIINQNPSEEIIIDAIIHYNQLNNSD